MMKFVVLWCVVLFYKCNADPVKRYMTLKDLVNNAVIDTAPSLPLERYGEKYYYFGTVYQGSYFQAMQFCNQHDMTLISIETKEENDFLFQSLRPFLGAGEYHFWTSGTTLTGGNWVWLATGKPIVFANWLPKQPDNAGNNEKCLEARYVRTNQGLVWNDHVCTVPKYVICEIALKKSVSNLLSGISSCNLTLINVPVV